MNKSKISVIVPVYNAELYIAKCVRSIQNQTYDNLEIILVDDGSSDNSGLLCEELAKADNRIRVFHKKNGGQSSARNLGLDVMTGDAVGFVDSDDWIEPDMYQRLSDIMIQTNAAIAVCGIAIDGPHGNIGYFYPNASGQDNPEVFSTLAALKENLNNRKITYSLTDKLFDKTVFQGLRMTEGKIFEDMEIIPQCIERANLVAYSSDPMYHYMMTEESTVRGKFKSKRLVEADIAWEKTVDYKERYPELYYLAYSSYIAICLKVIYLSRHDPASKEKRAALIKQLRGPLPREAIALLTKWGKLKLKMLRIGTFPFECLMKVIEICTM